MSIKLIDNFMRPFYEFEKFHIPNNIITQGVVGINPMTQGVDLNAVGSIYSKTYKKRLINIFAGQAGALIETKSTDITPKELESYSASIPTLVLSDGMKLNNVESLLQGEGSKEQEAAKVATELGTVILNMQQLRLKSLLDTVLVAEGALEDNIDSSLSSTAFNGSSVRELIADKFGERRSELEFYIVSSKTKMQMKNDALINYVQGSDSAMMLFSDGNGVPTFNGMIVIENDTICQAVGGSLPTYAVGRDVIGLDYFGGVLLNKVTTSLGGGTETTQFTFGIAPSVLGCNYTTTTRTAAAIYDKTNWQLVMPSVEVPILRIDFNGGA